MTAIRQRRVLDAEDVERMVDAAIGAACRAGKRVVVAVVDAGGTLLALRRTEGAQAASSAVAVDKARTAAIFRRPSRQMEEQVTSGRLGALALRGAAALTGGVPIVVEGEVVGGVGTSGETPDEDEAVSLVAAEAASALSVVPALSAAGARLVAMVAAREASRRGVAPVVAVVDTEGHLLHQWRPDDAQVASVGVALDKARTAAIFRRPSKVFEDQASGGRPSALHLAGAVPLQGGVPVVAGDRVVGAVGVSGARSADEDAELAGLAAAALAQAPAAAVVPAGELCSSFEAGGGIVLDDGSIVIDAGVRVAPGAAERHDHVCDVITVRRGRATLLLGGEMVSAVATGPGECRSDSLEGGDRREIAEGDVVVVPAGVPHQFVAVSEPFHYLAVKVQA